MIDEDRSGRRPRPHTENLPLSKVWIVAAKPFPDGMIAIYDDRENADNAAMDMNYKLGEDIVKVYESLIHIRRP